MYIEHTLSEQNHRISWQILTFGNNHCYLFSLSLFLRHVRREVIGPHKSRGENHISSLMKTEPADTVFINLGNSTDFDADTSKVK